MKSNRQGLRKASPCCAEFGPEDGIDARFWKKSTRSHGVCVKDLQLCKRAERIIYLAIAGEARDGLSDALVQSVELLNNGRLLVVYLYLPGNPDSLEIARMSAVLAGFKGIVRTLLAQSLHRRRVPSLRFRLSTVDRPFYFEQEV